MPLEQAARVASGSPGHLYMDVYFYEEQSLLAITICNRLATLEYILHRYFIFFFCSLCFSVPVYVRSCLSLSPCLLAEH